MPPEHHNHVGGRQPIIVGLIAVLSGVLAALAGLHPAGSALIDVALVATAAAAVTWAAASAPSWAVLVSSGVAAAFAGNVVWMAVGIAGALLAIFVRLKKRRIPWARSLATLAAVQVFARLHQFGFFGLSSIVALVALAVVLVLGIRRRRRAVRRRAWIWIGVTLGAAALAVVGVAAAGLTARAQLEEGNRQARSGLAALNKGDIPTAAAAFRASAAAFDKADGDLSAPWTQPSRLLPVIAQNRDALAELASQGAGAMHAAGDALAAGDPSTVRMVNGQIDLAAVRALVQPFTNLRAAIADMGSTIAAVKSPWLVAPVQSRLTALDKEVQKDGAVADNALRAVQVAPDLLGGAGARHYFIAFTTPSESRGLGGFMGNWAELTIDNGLATLSKFGRTTDLSAGGSNPTGRTITAPADFIKQWGPFGFVDSASGKANADVWSNITMAPDFPTVAQVIAQLYPQSGGSAIDGVFYVDPLVMAKLVGITGPIQVDGVAEPLTEDTLVNFILKGQYSITASAERKELLDVIAHSLVDKMFSISLPPPADLARTFGPLARQDRLMAWSVNPKEEDLFQRIGMAGAFPQLNGGDGLVVTTDNSAANKIDAYLKVAVNYLALPGIDGHTTGTATITLTNNAPASGLPDYVIGNIADLPTGTNHMFLSVYTALPVTDVELDGLTSGMDFSQTFGWNSATMFLDLAPGQTRTLKLQVEGTLSSVPYRFVSRIQPMALAETITATTG